MSISVRRLSHFTINPQANYKKSKQAKGKRQKGKRQKAKMQGG